MKIKNIFIAARRQYLEALIQKAVPASVQIRKEIGDYVKANEGQIDAFNKAGQEKFAAEKSSLMGKYIMRRVRALERIERIQADAWHEAFGEEAPDILQAEEG